MVTSWERVWNNKWVVLVASIWLQACAGVGYAFGTYSHVIKRTLHYNQKEINTLGVTKDIGDSVGLIAGTLCEVLPTWGLILVGATKNLLGYGGLWLIVTGRLRRLSFWAMCALICIGANGETYFNTAALLSSVRSFPCDRGPVVGILKAFAGLSGAIFTQMYAAFFAPDQASFIFIVAVGPALMALAVMFMIRPTELTHVKDGSESRNFNFVHSVCVVLAAYVMGVMLVQDLVPISDKWSIFFAAGLLVFLLLPLVTAFMSIQSSKENPVHSNSLGARPNSKKGVGIEEESLKVPLVEHVGEEQRRNEAVGQIASEEKQENSGWSESVRVKKRQRPHRGEDFTLREALVKADFWLLFFSLYCGAGSGLTVIDNLGQMSQAEGYSSAHVFVSLISVWNFLGRLAGGYSSEIVARRHAFPRPVVILVAQFVMATGLVVFAMGWPGSLYVGCALVGLGYGAHWSVVPATASELFGLKSFGMLYNFLTIANPAGSMVLSGAVAGVIYDLEAEKQQHTHHVNDNKNMKWCEGVQCFFATYLILAGVCVQGALLSTILVARTRTLYVTLLQPSLPRPSPSSPAEPSIPLLSCP